MKTIMTLIEIPANFKWKAQDENGSWWAYTHKPTKLRSDASWNIVSGDMIEIGQGNPNQDWQNTLQRIYEYEEVE